jgi:hypothetical protein
MLARLAGRGVQQHGHIGSHVNWLGLSGETDWNLMTRINAENFTFVTNNAADFRRLCAREPLHAGLVIIVPQVAPALQRELFEAILNDLADGGQPVNEAIEIFIAGSEVVIERYDLPMVGGR